jgi:hypothetical protein
MLPLSRTGTALIHTWLQAAAVVMLARRHGVRSTGFAAPRFRTPLERELTA